MSAAFLDVALVDVFSVVFFLFVVFLFLKGLDLCARVKRVVPLFQSSTA